MKKNILWIYLMCKRLLKKPSFLIILGILPVLLLGYRVLIAGESGTIRVGMYFEEPEGALAKAMQQELVGKELFAEFYVSASEEDLYADVASGRAECGYLLPGDVIERLVEKDWDGCITQIVSDNSRYADYVNETIYCQVFYEMAETLLLDYMRSHNYYGATDAQLTEACREAFAAKENGIIAFEYEYVEGKGGIQVPKPEKTGDYDHLTKPIRGTIALFVLLAGMAGLIFWYQDEQEGRFQCFLYQRLPWLSVSSLLLPTLLGGIVGLGSLYLSGVGMSFPKELALMLLYCLLVTGFCNLLRFLVPSAHAVCAMIPLFSLASFVCCPIIMDITTFAPFLRYLRPLLVVDYYLEGYLYPHKMLRLAFAALLVLPVTYVLDVYRVAHRKE